MKTPTALTSVALLSVLLVAACSSGAAPAASNPPAASPSPAASAPPDASTSGDPGSAIGGDPGDMPTDGPVDGGPNPPGNDRQPKIVVPVPGQQNVHAVPIEQLDARVEGRHAVLNARWTSGVDPCYVLDHVAFKRDGTTIAVSVFEGTGNPDVMCVEIAQEKVTAIDLGELDPGTYTVVATDGPAAAITFTVD